MRVDVTGDGRLQLTDDAMVFPPMTTAEVQALANAIPAADAVSANINLGDAMDLAVHAIVFTFGGTYAQLTVQDAAVVMVSDRQIFDALREDIFGAVDPDVSSFVYGPLAASVMEG